MSDNYILSPIESGDIIGAYLPSFINRGQPGPDFRLCIVLGLEVDEQKNTLEGLWTVRLSERLETVRPWDYYLASGEITAVDGIHLNRDYVIRTPRVDLIPATPAYMHTEVFGAVKPASWDGIAFKIREGLASPFRNPSYGPRDKLAHTVVKTSMSAADSFFDFDAETMVAHIALPPMAPDVCRAVDSYGLARQEQIRQQRELSRLIQGDFSQALRNGQPWDFEEYRRTLLVTRLSSPHAAPAP